MSQLNHAEYYRRRVAEAQTRASAATLPEVRRVHAEMAQRYQALLAEAERTDRSNMPRPVLGIVTHI